MSVLSVSQVGAVGLISTQDQPPGEIPPNAWNVAQNVRFSSGKVEAGKGWASTGTVTLSGTARLLDFVAGGLSTWWLLFSDDAIHSVVGGYLNNDVTRASGAYTSGDWTAVNFQGIPVATNNADLPQTQFVPGGIPVETTVFQDLPNWPSGDRCRIIATLRNFLVVADITESGTRYRTKIRWSNAAAPGNLPADWAVADPTSLANEIVLGTGQGGIVAMRPLRDSLIVYREEGVGVLEYVGGALVMRYRDIPDQWGAQAPHAVIPLPTGLHLVFTKTDVVLFDGQSPRSIAKDRTQRLLSALSDTRQDLVEGFRVRLYDTFSEVWIGIPGESGVIEEVWVYNYREDQWAGPRQVPSLRDYQYLPILEVESKTNLQLTWKDAAVTPDLQLWSDWREIPWNAVNRTTLIGAFGFFGVKEDGGLIRLDYGFDSPGSSEYQSLLVRQDLDLVGDENVAVVTAIYPVVSVSALSETVTPLTWGEVSLIEDATWDDPAWSSRTWEQFEGAATPLRFTVGTHDTAGGVPRWRDASTYLPGDYKGTTKARGRRHALQITSASVNWRLSGYRWEFENVGRVE